MGMVKLFDGVRFDLMYGDVIETWSTVRDGWVKYTVVSHSQMYDTIRCIETATYYADFPTYTVLTQDSIYRIWRNGTKRYDVSLELQALYTLEKIAN